MQKLGTYRNCYDANVQGATGKLSTGTILFTIPASVRIAVQKYQKVSKSDCQRNEKGRDAACSGRTRSRRTESNVTCSYLRWTEV